MQCRCKGSLSIVVVFWLGNTELHSKEKRKLRENLRYYSGICIKTLKKTLEYQHS